VRSSALAQAAAAAVVTGLVTARRRRPERPKPPPGGPVQRGGFDLLGLESEQGETLAEQEAQDSRLFRALDALRP
jgi:hypothetical protein